MNIFALRENLRSSLWFVPTLSVIVCITLALVLARVDEQINSGWIQDVTFKGNADNARTVLTTIASSMITFMGLVFTITIVVLQLASQQLSPRVLRTFLRDRLSQLSLGVFVGTFTYSMLVLRELRPGPDGAFVPNISITVAFLLVLVSIGFFVGYIHHIAQSIRIGNLADAITGEADEAIEQIYEHEDPPDRVDEPDGEPVQTITSPGRGILAALDRDALAAVAQRHDAVVKVLPAVGDFVPSGSPVLEVYGNRVPEEAVHELSLSVERTMAQDPAFGFRQLVDIGQKALSPGINDPTTAVQAIDMMHELLRKLATRPFPSGQRCDENGHLRVIFPIMTWDAYIHLACDELRHYGATSLQVMRRLRAMLEDLRTVVSEERRRVIDQELELLSRTIKREWPEIEDRELGTTGDRQGMGD